MTYIRDTAPLAEPVCDPFYGDKWDSFIGSIMHRSLPDSLSTPCLDCGEKLIVCACVRQGEMM